MLASAPIQLLPLASRQWDGFRVSRNAIPYLLDQLETLFHTEVQDFFNGNAHRFHSLSRTVFQQADSAVS